MDISSLSEAVLRRVFVPVEASGRHVHVTKQQAMALFGQPLTQKRPLSQPGQFLANQRVTVIGPKGRFENVAVLGPERGEAQVEISLTDGRTLGIAPPVRLSGDVANSPGCVLQTEKGSVTLSAGVICARRHIHMTPEDAALYGVRDRQQVSLQLYSARPALLQEVVVRVSPDFATAVHLDYDEANGCGFENGDLGRLIP